MIAVRRAAAADAALLAEIAARTFREAFGADNRPEDLARHLANAYGVAQQTAELADPSIVSLVAEVDGETAGYAMLRDEGAPPCVEGARPIRLWRFYVARGWHGRGVAPLLMRAVEEAAHERDARTLWLGVWERNARAQAFYRKVGFVDVGSERFVVGADPQTDRVMARPLAGEER